MNTRIFLTLAVTAGFLTPATAMACELCKDSEQLINSFSTHLILIKDFIN